MKRILVAALAVAGMAGSAFAADLPSRKGAPLAPLFVGYSWTGFYAGVHAGAAFSGSGDITELAPMAPYITYNLANGVSRLKDKTAFNGGLQVGYNYQMGRFVAGVEADISYLGYKTSEAQVNPATGALLAGGDTIGKKKADWLGTVRGRFGMASDRLLVFLTGGVAFSDLKYSITDNCVVGGCGPGTISGSTSSSLGWAAGGGVEYAFTNNLVAKAEYLYTRFEGKHFDGVINGGAFMARYAADPTVFHIVRAGLNYKF